MDSQAKRVLLFVPAYNCEKQVTRVIEGVKTTLPKCVAEIMIVDNGSQDNTRESVASIIKHWDVPEVTVNYYLNKDNYGLGGSHKVAYQHMHNNDFSGVITLHGDDQASLKQINSYIDQWANGELEADAILGSRFTNGSTRSGYPWHRVWGNHVLNAIWSIVLFRRVSDIGSGVNFISAEALRKFNYLCLPENLVFNPQQLLELIAVNAKLVFVPIHWVEEDQKSNAVPWKVFLGAVEQVLRHRVIRPFTGAPNYAQHDSYDTELVMSSRN